MEIDPSTTVKGHAVNLVALDGSVTTTLAFDDATHSGGTLTWSVATQPWSDGDLLMLRIHKPNLQRRHPQRPRPQRRRHHLQYRHDNLHRKRASRRCAMSSGTRLV